MSPHHIRKKSGNRKKRNQVKFQKTNTFRGRTEFIQFFVVLYSSHFILSLIGDFNKYNLN